MKVTVILFLVLLSVGCASSKITASNNPTTQAQMNKRVIDVDLGDGRKGRVIVREVDERNSGIPHKCGGRIVPLYRPAPTYPLSLKKQRIEGIVVVELTINETGYVSKIKFDTYDHEDFAMSTIAAVKFWRFKPLICDGKPSEFKVVIPFPFSLHHTKRKRNDKKR